jgi:hypothetical protein
MRILRPLLLAACLAGFSIPFAAQATEFCHLRETPDGFVALRAGPGTQHRLIARMKPQDEVLYGLERKGKWVDVTWWPGDSRQQEGGFGKGVHGWVHDSLIDDMCG